MIKEIDYQERAVEELSAKCRRWLGTSGDRKKIVFKAPTGAGKTVMASRLIERLAEETAAEGGRPIAFVWLAPNQLHEQSCLAMRRLFAEAMTMKAVMFSDLDRSPAGGFRPNEILFLNWQSVNSEDNIFVREGEQGASLYELADRTRETMDIVAIIDEAHLFVGASASRGVANQSENVLKRLMPKLEVRISATPDMAGIDDMVSDPRDAVIAAGMIKKGININPNLGEDDGEGVNIALLKRALAKRQELKEAYAKEGAKINPLLLIQLPNDAKAMDEDDRRLVDEVRGWLEKSAGISEANGKLGVWLSGDKAHLEGIEKPDSLVEALIFKQAIAMGWDCPRAAVLLIFREMKSVTFTMQTVGRIMRMPEQRHYMSEALNHGYVYTNLSREVIEIAKDDAQYLVEPIHAKRREGLNNITLISAVSTRKAGDRNRLGPDFYDDLVNEFETAWFNRPVQTAFKFNAFEEE